MESSHDKLRHELAQVGHTLRVSRHECQSYRALVTGKSGGHPLALILQPRTNVGPMSKILLAVLLAMPGGFVLVPALLLIRRRLAKRTAPVAPAAAADLAA